MNNPNNSENKFPQERTEPSTQLKPPTDEPTAHRAPKKKRGRPRSFAEGSLANICVSIEAEQKQWLDKVAASAPHESASKVVREALDLWYAVHKEGTVLTHSLNATASINIDEDDDFDYSWH